MLSRLWIVTAFGLAACAAGPQPQPTMATSAGYTPASRSMAQPELTPKQLATRALSKARCDHALRCGRVGDGKSYASRDECSTDLDAIGYAKLETRQCRIDENALSVCLAEIDTEQCRTDVAESVDRVKECLPSVLCEP